MTIPESKKRGAPLKAHRLSGRVAFRASKELEDWLEKEGENLGLDKGTMARMLLMEKMNEAKKGQKKPQDLAPTQWSGEDLPGDSE